MVKIFRPEPTGGPAGTAQISVGASTGGERIGRVQAQAGLGLQSQAQQGALQGAVGNIIEQEGTRYFEETKRAHNMTLVNNSITEATLEFAKAKQARIQQSTDKNGNPNYRSLVDDIGVLGDDISKRIGGNIQFNSEAVRQFDTKFKSFVSSQQISALKVARTQQISFGKASLDKGLGNLVLQGAGDELGNIGTYQTQGQDMLNDALASGIISSADHTQMSNDFQVVLKEASISDTITTNPAEAQQVLQQSAEQLGIPEEKKVQLEKTLDAKIRSDEIQIKKAEQKAKIDDNDRVSRVITSAENRIEADAMREDELLRLENTMPVSSFKGLKKKFIKEAKKRQKRNNQLLAMSTSVVSGEGAGNFSTKQIDNHYKFLVEAHEFNVRRPATLIEKANLIAQHKTPVKAFAKEMNQTFISGNVNDAVNALSAYTYLKDRELPSLDGNSFTKQTEAMANYAEVLVDRGGLTPKQAILKARKDVIDVLPEIRNIRSAQFRTITDFKSGNIEDTAAEELGAENFFGINQKISDQALSTYSIFVRNAFTDTGNEEGAKKTARSLMAKTHGLSSVAGPDDVYMFAPPEKFFPKIAADELRQNLINEVTPFLPEGTDPNNVSIVADDATIGQVRIIRNEDGTTSVRAAPSYIVQQTIISEDGGTIRIAVTNPNTGRDVRWAPDPAEIKARKEAAEKEETRKEFKARRNITFDDDTLKAL